IVLLHLAAQVEERERPGGEDDVGEKAAGVGEIAVERGAGDEHEEADDVGLQVVARRLAVPQLVDEEEAEEAHARAEELAADGVEQRPGEDAEGERVPRRGPGARAEKRHARRLEEERERAEGERGTDGERRQLARERQRGEGGGDHEVRGRFVNRGEPHRRGLMLRSPAGTRRAGRRGAPRGWARQRRRRRRGRAPRAWSWAE